MTVANLDPRAVRPNAAPPPDTRSGAAAQESQTAGSVRVRPGDTLTGIAARNGVSLEALLNANPQFGPGRRDPDLIHAGERIALPSGGERSVRVRPGDTLTGIAERNGVSLEGLIAANPAFASGRRDPDRIDVGERILLPSTTRTGPTSAPVAAPERANGTPANGLPLPGEASLAAARYAEGHAEARSTGYCYAYVKRALQASGAVSDYIPGVAAKDAGPQLERRGFVNVLNDPRHGIRSPYDAPAGAVLVYGAAPGATDRNARYGHIEIRTQTGFASDYVSVRARTGPASEGLEGRGRVLIGVYVKPDAASAAPPATSAPSAPAGSAGGDYAAANLRLGANEGYRADILHASRLSGLPPQAVAAIIDAESAKTRAGVWRADSYNDASGAAGLTQFIASTWRSEALTAGTPLNTELRARGVVGADGRARVGDAALLQLRYDPRLSMLAAVGYGQTNLRALQADGVVPRDADPALVAKVAYIAHHEGLGGARAYFRGEIVSVNAKFASNVSDPARYLAQAGGNRELAYHNWLSDYTDSRLDVRRFMANGGAGIDVPSIRSLVR